MKKKPTNFIKSSKTTDFRPIILTPMPPPQRPMEDHISLYVTYEEVTGQKASIGYLTSLLSQLSLNHVLQVVSTVNNLYSGEHVEEEQDTHRLQVMLARELFSADMREKLTASPFMKDRKTLLFHRHQQLFLLRHALMSCSIKVDAVWNEQSAYLFGEACLVVNGLLHSEEAGKQYSRNMDENSLLSLVLMLLPMVERGSDHEPITILGRASQLWLEIPEEAVLKQSERYIPLKDVFREVYGVELDTFLRILVILYLQVRGATASAQEPWTQFVVNVNTTFANARYSKEDLNKVMSIISYPLAGMGDMLYSVPTQARELDLTVLESYPSIEVEEGVYVLYDRNLLIRFFTSGVWWLINKGLPEDKRTDFSRFFGEVFALYVERVLSHAYKSASGSMKRNLFLRPMFGKNDEACDVLITEDDRFVGSSWVMIETKASLLTTQAKYSGKVTNLQRDLDGKFAVSTGREKRGVTQLANSINKLARGMTIEGTDLNFSQPKKIYPVLISYDIALNGKFTADYLDGKMREALKELPSNAPRIMPLTVLTMEDVEVFTSVSSRHALSNLLASYQHLALPLMGFKNHIINRFRAEIRLDESFPKLFFEAMADAIRGDFADVSEQQS